MWPQILAPVLYVTLTSLSQHLHLENGHKALNCRRAAASVDEMKAEHAKDKERHLRGLSPCCLLPAFSGPWAPLTALSQALPAFQSSRPQTSTKLRTIAGGFP